MRGTFAAWATKAMGPTQLRQRVFTLGLSPVELLELGHGEPLLELDGVATRDLASSCLPLYGFAGPVTEPSA